eukprot:3649115-Rhodomonas_salina.2
MYGATSTEHVCYPLGLCAAKCFVLRARIVLRGAFVLTLHGTTSTGPMCYAHWAAEDAIQQLKDMLAQRTREAKRWEEESNVVA